MSDERTIAIVVMTGLTFVAGIVFAALGLNGWWSPLGVLLFWVAYWQLVCELPAHQADWLAKQTVRAAIILALIAPPIVVWRLCGAEDLLFRGCVALELLALTLWVLVKAAKASGTGWLYARS